MPVLTILLPTYNGRRYLGEQLRSIQDQTLTNWRLLACDDGSTDGTQSTLHAAAASDTRIAVLPSQGNQGQRRRLRQLAAATDAELIAIADQDDIWAADKLEQLIAAFGGNDLCFGGSWLIDANGREIGRDLSASFGPAYRPGDRLTYLFRPLVSAHALIARRHLLNDLVLSRHIAFDWLMTLEAAFGRGLDYVPVARTLHRIHATNQNNAGLAGEPERPGPWDWRDLQAAHKGQARDRSSFLARLEHLRFSDNVPDEVRRRAEAAYSACRPFWYDGRPSMIAGRVLLGRLVEHLGPLAGSEQDFRYARSVMKRLCADVFHPVWFSARAESLQLERGDRASIGS